MLNNFNAYYDLMINLMEENDDISLNDFAVCKGNLTLCKFIACCECDFSRKGCSNCSLELVDFLSRRYKEPKIDLKIGDTVINNFTNMKATVSYLDDKTEFITVKYENNCIETSDYRYWRKKDY